MDAVESVLVQTYCNFELIIVDDGSTDNTPALLDDLSDERVIVLSPKIKNANKGVSAARNDGIQASRGELIAFLDSDDLWMPDKLKVQADFFLNNPEALICQTEEIWIRNGKRVNPAKKHKKEKGFIFERSLELCLVSPSAVMMRRDFFDTIGYFDENLPACEDYDLWLRTAIHHPIHLIDTALTIKNGGHEDQLSRQPGLDKYRIESILKLLNSDALSGQHKKAAIKVLTQKCQIYAQGCEKRGKLDEAEKYKKIALAWK